MAETTSQMHVHMPTGSWHRNPVLIVALYCAAVLLLYSETAWSIFSVWQRSETFAHGFLIVPISLWLVWDRRVELAKRSVQSNFWVLLLIIPVGLLWLVANLVNVLVVQQLAFVGLLIAGVWFIVGNSVAAVLAFPLAFLFLGVPMGENLVPPMMDLTAVYTVKLVQMTGIPVYREGLFFALPSGNWSVVEACSGVRYLIASVTLGILYAFLTYRSPLRRTAFIVASAIVPIVANVLRAFIIVMLGHFSDMTVAVGVDHLIYGWVFFGVVMLLLFWLGSLWREDMSAGVATIAPSAAQQGGDRQKPGSVLARGLAVLPLIAVWPMVVPDLENGSAQAVATQLSAPAAAAEWRQIDPPDWDFSPQAEGADRDVVQYYQSGDRVVGLYLQQYLRQRQGAELVSDFSEYSVAKAKWRLLKKDREILRIDASELNIDQRYLARDGRRILLWNWYRVGDRYTTNPYLAKVLEALAMLGLGRSDAARISLVTSSLENEQPGDALRVFLAEHLASIEQVLDENLGAGQL